MISLQKSTYSGYCRFCVFIIDSIIGTVTMIRRVWFLKLNNLSKSHTIRALGLFVLQSCDSAAAREEIRNR